MQQSFDEILGETVKVTDEVPMTADVSWKGCVSIEWNRYKLKK